MVMLELDKDLNTPMYIHSLSSNALFIARIIMWKAIIKKKNQNLTYGCE